MSRQITLLVAEDDPNDVLLLERAFARAGLEAPVRFVRDGEEAVEYLRQARSNGASPQTLPHVLLLDLRMPRMDGFQVLTWLRQEPGLHCLRVVVLSASRYQKDIDRAYSLGAHSYLAKPHDAAGMVQVMQVLHQYWAEWNETPEHR